MVSVDGVDAHTACPKACGNCLPKDICEPEHPPDDCEDDDDDKCSYGNLHSITCDYLRRVKKDEDRDWLCEKAGKFDSASFKYKKAKEMCPKTCGLCGDDEDEDDDGKYD